jgi:hypothetical protein
MGLFRKSRGGVAETIPSMTSGSEIDLVRFHLLLQTSEKLHEAGVDYESIQRRASDDAISFNEAVQAMYAERFRG